MVQRHELSLTQTQRLILSQTLRQALKILQYPLLELREIVQDELLQNPFLEDASVDDEQNNNEDIKSEVENKKEDQIEINNLQNYLQDESRDYYTKEEYDYNDESNEGKFYNIITKPQTLPEFLLEQLRLSVNDDSEEYKIGEVIIGNIDKNGYLTGTLEDIANIIGEVGTEKIENVLKLIQTFDPAGVGARDLKECLLIQIEDKQQDGLPENLGELAKKILNEYWSDFEKHHYQSIAKSLKIEQDEVERACQFISRLDPKPGRNFDWEKNSSIIPDVFVEKIDDKYVVKINEDDMPKLRVNRLYYKLLNKEVNPETKEYMNEKLQQAYAIIKGIEERKKNLLNVTKIIVDIQKDFLDNGIEHLKPLALKDVAVKSNLHESTVSRLTSNKYVHTPYGFIPFKAFFATKISRTDGDDVSASSIKEMIKNIVESEDLQNPFSDKKIVEILQSKGIKLARRTIAKYREEMNIKPSNMRGVGL